MAKSYLKSKKQNRILLISEILFEDFYNNALLGVGKLNNDGQPDLLIYTTYDHNLYRPTLFLFKASKGKVTYHEVTERSAAGCY